MASDEQTPHPPYQHYEQTYEVTKIHFYLNSKITSPDQYSDMIHRINTATDHDEITIHINTPGGDVATGIQIIGAMRNTPARVITSLEGVGASMGATIFLAGDEMAVHDMSYLMFHNYSSGAFGKGHEITTQIAAVNDWMGSIINTIWKPFITDDEVEQIISGRDLYIQAPEVRDRLIKMRDILAAQQAQSKAADATNNQPTEEQPVEEQPIDVPTPPKRRSRSKKQSK